MEKSTYWNEFLSITSFVRSLNFPVFLAPGNHDGFAAYESMNRKSRDWELQYSDVITGPDRQATLYDGKHFWQKMFGPRYFSFDYGDWHFAVLDTYELARFFRLAYGAVSSNHGGWISRGQMSWLESDLHSATAAGKKIILVGHHDPRGGALGMFYETEKYRQVRRRILPMQQEFFYQINRFTNDPLTGAQEWASVRSDMPGREYPDGNYDPSAELMRLIGSNNVTHFLLGHVHGDYQDEVIANGRKVEFIHTTTLSARSYRVRNESNYQPRSGDGLSVIDHWGYRIFEATPEGELRELYAEGAEKKSMDLGDMRFQIGVDPDYAGRPIGNWLPYDSYISQLTGRRKPAGTYRGRDPFLLLNALFLPGVNPLATRLYASGQHREAWDPQDMKTLETLLTESTGKAQSSAGYPINPRTVMAVNLNLADVSGILEFPAGPSVEADARASWVREGKPELGEILGLLPIEDVEISPEKQSGWIRIPLQLPSSGDKERYLKIEFGE